MLLDLHKMSLEEIKGLECEQCNNLTVRIENKVEIEKLIVLNEILKKVIFLVSVIIESESYQKDDFISGLNVFSYL